MATERKAASKRMKTAGLKKPCPTDPKDIEQLCKDFSEWAKKMHEWGVKVQNWAAGIDECVECPKSEPEPPGPPPPPPYS